MSGAVRPHDLPIAHRDTAVASAAPGAAQPARLAAGGLVDRTRPLAFRFDGRDLAGYAGDTLASALVANGVRLVGRSFKYHRPRGILTAGSEEPNALVELRSGARREPNTRATVAELFDGLEARSQNRFPSLAVDLGAVNSLLAPLFVAGFYYKTFMWPAAFWERLYEPLIRRAAGLGRASDLPDPDSYERATAHCDLLVIGAGPAGLAAALAAGRAGARVILADEDVLPGGRLNGERLEVAGRPGRDWAAEATRELEALPELRVMRRTTVFGAYDGGTYGLVERVSDHLPVPPEHQPRQRLWHVVARRAVLAAGAIERPLVFGGNDRPGVMTASAVRTYLNRFAAAPGRRAVLFTTTDDGWRTAADARAAGIQVEAVVDARPEVEPAVTGEAARDGTRLLLGAVVTGTRGRQALRQVEVRDASGGTHRIPCDLLAVAGGWNPQVALATHLGGKPRWSEEAATFLPGDPPPGMSVAGAAAGRFGLGEALREGHEAGRRVAEELGLAPAPGGAPAAGDEPVGARPLWHVAGSRGKAFVDLQHDVTAADVALAAREGFRSVEHLKRYTTLGMATDQGKTSNLNGHAILAALTGRSIPETGTTVSRPPHTPVAIGAFAGHGRGRHFRPTRLTPGHAWAEAQGATFVESGPWLRAQWFARPGETDWLDTVSREVRAVREGVGFCDVSTLGKIDVQGPDAATLLDRLYCNLMSTVAVGKTRYGLMLREDGLVLDDGTAARFGAAHFVLSTTTANAARVMQHIDHARQVLWPELDVQAVSVTEPWFQVAVAGPRSRPLLERVLGDALDLSDARLPYMGCAAFAWRGVPARIFRLSFSGELAYELAVPARYGGATLAALTEAGRELGAVPYGTEALGVMRVEKGHVAGNELDGTTTAADLGLGRMMSRKKDFVGRVLAGRPGLVDPDRPSLAGFKPADRGARLRAGAHFLAIGAPVSLAGDEGQMTSVAFSPTLGHWIGLGLIRRGPSRHGERVRAYDPVRGGDVEVEVCPPVFVDPDGSRLHG